MGDRRATASCWLLQSRPVTTEIRGVPPGPIYGPGPVAETFPEPLTELEHDLWVPPLREAVREAVLLAGRGHARRRSRPARSSCRSTATSPSTCASPARSSPKRTLLAAAQPGARRPPAARGLAGRPAAGGPARASPSTSSTGSTPTSRRCRRSTELTSRQLIALLHRSRAVLRALHAHEILMGMLTDTGRNRMTGASVALRVLVEARRGRPDRRARSLERSPVVLALTPPRVAPAPGAAGRGHRRRPRAGTADERQRQRHPARGAAAAGPLGPGAVRPGRVGARRAPRPQSGDLTEPELIRHMTLEHVEAVATKRAVVDPAARAAPTSTTSARRCRPRFQLSDRGKRHPRAGGERGGRRHRRRRRRRPGPGHLRRRRPARRLGARHHHAHPRPRPAARPG